MQIIYRRLGENKGTKRLWLTGKRLADAGILPGLQYDISYGADQSLTIRLSQSGARRVSSKMDHDSLVPVIDIQNSSLERVFGKDVKRVRAVISNGEIVVTIHPDDAAALERIERAVETLRNGNPLRIGSLAHGAGVLDHAVHSGLRRSGVQVKQAFACEIDHDYLETSLRNNPIWEPDTIAFEAPMEEIETNLIGKVDLLIAGLPCEGASLAGRAKNGNRSAETHDGVGHLFVAFLQIVKVVNPVCVLLEEVLPYQNTVSMHVIRQVLDKLGYDVHETVLDESMGALESRRRLCAVAMTRGVPFRLEDLVPVRMKEAVLGDILEDIPPDDASWKTYSYLQAKEERDIANGKGFRQQLVGPESTSVGCIGKGYFKVRSTEPRVRHPQNPSLSRLLTVREHARVKTIPEGLVAGLSATKAHEVLGQSVIHCAFEAVAMLIGKSLGALLNPIVVNGELPFMAVPPAGGLSGDEQLALFA
jgi:DNA (cytosine-5)-methyltransferase 1